MTGRRGCATRSICSAWTLGAGGRDRPSLLAGDRDGRAPASAAPPAPPGLVRPLLLPRPYDLALVVALNLQAWGEALGLYDSITWFDNVVHFSLPFFLAPTVYVALARIDVVPDPADETDTRHYVGIADRDLRARRRASAPCGSSSEWASDQTLGSSLQTRQRRTPSATSPPTRSARLCGVAPARLLGPLGLGLGAPDPRREPLRGHRGRPTRTRDRPILATRVSTRHPPFGGCAGW